MRIIFLFLLICILGCSAYRKKASSTCQEYFEFLDENWVQTDNSKLLYQFRGNPEYWKDEKKYLRSSCFEGLSKKQLFKLLGNPSKQFIFHDFEMVYYCFSEDCLKAMTPGGKELVINFDTNGIVILAYFNPSGIDTD